MRTNQPNILWMTTDHHVFANHYAFQNSYLGKLETHEKLCREGRKYEEAYSVCPLCTPARASMLTGRYPHNHGMILNPVKNAVPATPEKTTRQDFDTEDELFSYGMKEKGYRIAQFGKWYGGEKTAADFGFEGWSQPWYGRPYQSQIYREYLTRNNLQDPLMKVTWSADQPDEINQVVNPTKLKGLGFGPFRTTRKLLSPKETHEAYFVAALACDWLREYKKNLQDRPFLLKADVWGPHHPYDPAEPFWGSINPEALKQPPSFAEDYKNKPSNYAHYKEFWCCLSDMNWPQMSRVLAVSYEHAVMVDHALGRIVSLLEQLELEDNTIVILTADHGDILGSHGGLFNKGAIMVEEIMKIPLVIKWPWYIEAGSISQEFVTNMDIPVTLAGITEAQPKYRMDGINMLDKRKREHLMCQTFGCNQREFIQRMLRWKNYKYIAHYQDIDELYDLDKDPFEMLNQINSPDMKNIASDMKVRLRETMELYHDTQLEAGEILLKLQDRL